MQIRKFVIHENEKNPEFGCEWVFLNVLLNQSYTSRNFELKKGIQGQIIFMRRCTNMKMHRG